MAPPTSDFKKRPKAKVGKRAPAKLNATDTAFKTASVAVRSQDQSLQKSKHIIKQDDAASSTSAAAKLELPSSRGNALSTLQTSLRHHAPAVRASGLKGIRDAVQSLSSLEATLGTTILEANLPSLLPNMCRCWLDEDDDVRSLAIKLFGDIIKQLSSSSASEQSDLKCLAPFVPILGAYASSALNSLDRDIRKDGASIVGILASSDPSPSYSTIVSSPNEEGELSAMSREVGKHIYSFIPPLERLLLSMSLGRRDNHNGGSKEGGAKKRRRDENGNKQPTGSSLTAKDSTLLSVKFLLYASLVAEKNVISSGRNSGSTSRRLAPSLTVSGECTFTSGGSAHANSLFLFREGDSSANVSFTPIRSIFDLPSVPTDETIDDETDKPVEEYSLNRLSSSTQGDTSIFEKIQVLNSLLETLRVKFVELTHSGRKPTTGKDGLLLPSADLDALDTLVQTMRFIHQHYLIHQSRAVGSHLPKISTDGNQRQAKKRGTKATSATKEIGECIVMYQTIVQKTSKLLLETFPISPMDGKSASRYELTNAGICSALAEFGGGEGRLSEDCMKQNSSQWIVAVFSYILPRLDSATDMEDDSAGEVATNMLLMVLDKLLLPHSFHRGSDGHELVPSYLLDSSLKRQELLEAFGVAFFPQLAFPSTIVNEEQKKSSIFASSVSDAVEQKISELASTAVGKTAAMLLVTLITQAGDLSIALIDDEMNLYEKRTVLLLQMSSVLPLYIKSWGGRLPTETGRVLSALIAIVRQWSAPSTGPLHDDVKKPIDRSLNDLCFGLRSLSDALFTSNKKISSIFESLPEQVQKLAVGLIGMMGYPSEALTRSLSKICSKPYDRRAGPGGDSYIGSDMRVFIMEVMHSLRRTLPMPSYLKFLIDSSGINHATGSLERVGSTTNSLTDAVFCYDRSIEQLSRFLITSCGQATTKVLPMILPILQSWLLPPTSVTDDIVKQLVQARAATSILAAFAWDDVLSYGVARVKSDVIPPEFLRLDDAFDQILVDSIINQLELSARLWSISGDGFMDDPIEHFLAHLLGPVTILLRYCRGMLEKFVVRTSCRIVQESKDNSAAERSSNNEVTAMEDVSSNKVNVAGVLVKSVLLVLKSKYPASIAKLVRSDAGLSDNLMSAAADIEKAVSKGHLAHVGSKLVHQLKTLQR